MRIYGVAMRIYGVQDNRCNPNTQNQRYNEKTTHV